MFLIIIKFTCSYISLKDLIFLGDNKQFSNLEGKKVTEISVEIPRNSETWAIASGGERQDGYTEITKLYSAPNSSHILKSLFNSRNLSLTICKIKYSCG